MKLVRESIFETKRNVIDINLIIPDKITLKQLNTIPTFKNLFHPKQLKQLDTGNNYLSVNHTVWGTLIRMTSTINYQVKKI